MAALVPRQIFYKRLSAYRAVIYAVGIILREIELRGKIALNARRLAGAFGVDAAEYRRRSVGVIKLLDEIVPYNTGIAGVIGRLRCVFLLSAGRGRCRRFRLLRLFRCGGGLGLRRLRLGALLRTLKV